MVEYILLEQARKALKGSIIVEVISLGEVTVGNGKKGAYSKQMATLKDNSGIQQLTLWNADIGQLDLHKFYEIENPYWTEYNGEPQLSFGNYYKLHPANKTDLLTSDGTSDPKQSLEQAQESDNREPGIELPEISANLEEAVVNNTILLMQIDIIVRKTLTKYRANNVEELNNQKVGMFVKENFEDLKKSNLIKASQM